VVALVLVTLVTVKLMLSLVTLVTVTLVTALSLVTVTLALDLILSQQSFLNTVPRLSKKPENTREFITMKKLKNNNIVTIQVMQTVCWKLLCL
jgi:hypothetical protein